MSSPSRQIANRRLPPLPNGGSRYSPVRRKMSPNHSSTGYPSKTTSSASSTSPPHGSSSRSSNYNHNTNHKDFSSSLSDGPFRPALMTSKPLADRKNGSVIQGERFTVTGDFPLFTGYLIRKSFLIPPRSTQS